MNKKLIAGTLIIGIVLIISLVALRLTSKPDSNTAKTINVANDNEKKKPIPPTYSSKYNIDNAEIQLSETSGRAEITLSFVLSNIEVEPYILKIGITYCEFVMSDGEIIKGTLFGGDEDLNPALFKGQDTMVSIKNRGLQFGQFISRPETPELEYEKCNINESTGFKECIEISIKSVKSCLIGIQNKDAQADNGWGIEPKIIMFEE